MSSSDFTFKQAEKLIEELKIITPTLEILLKRANDIKDANERSIMLNEQIEHNLKEFDNSLKSAIAGELQKRLKQIDELNELESSLNKNVAYLKKTVKETRTVKSFNCILMIVFTAVAVFYAAKSNILF